jgi:dipeptidase E
MKKLLLLSNSTLPGESFFQWPEPFVKDFLGAKPMKILFFPFAGVTFSFDDYFQHVRSRFADMGHEVISAHQAQDKAGALDACDAIAVGGGNTFQLIHYLQDGWMELIREHVTNGKPYIGWSAGSNVATPTIKTTNDMPIVEPKRFEALNLAPFQINPHYTEAAIPNHGGETRPDRIREFLEVNPDVTVLGLPEGSLIEVKGDQVFFKGKGTLVIFRKGQEPSRISKSSQIQL